MNDTEIIVNLSNDDPGRKTVKASAKKKAAKTSKPAKAPAKKTLPVTPSRRTKVKPPKPAKKKPAKKTAPARKPKAVLSPTDAAKLKAPEGFGISRVHQEAKKNFGWAVRMGAPWRMVFFSDRKNGGTKAALKLAEAKRDELFAKMPVAFRVRAANRPARRIAA